MHARELRGKVNRRSANVKLSLVRKDRDVRGLNKATGSAPERVIAWLARDRLLIESLAVYVACTCIRPMLLSVCYMFTYRAAMLKTVGSDLFNHRGRAFRRCPILKRRRCYV